MVASEALHEDASAPTVLVKNGKTVTTDGPFAETKEQLGGVNVIEAEHIDEATDWASKLPCAPFGSIEVRPVWKSSYATG